MDFLLLEKKIKQSKKVLLIVHPNPDADALGSAFAMAYYCKKILGNKDSVTIFSLDSPHQAFQSLFPIKKVVTEFPRLERSGHDLIIFLDRSNTFHKIKFDQELARLSNPPAIINIDHHEDPPLKGVINFIDHQAAATCLLIYRFLQAVDFKLSPQVAQYLLVGIFGDTGGFLHSNTDPEVLEVSGKLMLQGASLSKIKKVLFEEKSLRTLKIWSVALERATVNPKTGMAASFITKEDLKRIGATPEDLTGLSEILNTIAGSRFSLVLSEYSDNKIKASLRSEKHKGVDVAQIARQFRGGGHQLSSGFEIKGKLKQQGNRWVIE
jgi:phosphoesterase RecJ-like protein